MKRLQNIGSIRIYCGPCEVNTLIAENANQTQTFKNLLQDINYGQVSQKRAGKNYLKNKNSLGKVVVVGSKNSHRNQWDGAYRTPSIPHCL